MDDADKAWEEYRQNVGDVGPSFVFIDGYEAGRRSRDAEVAELKKKILDLESGLELLYPPKRGDTDAEPEPSDKPYGYPPCGH